MDIDQSVLAAEIDRAVDAIMHENTKPVPVTHAHAKRVGGFIQDEVYATLIRKAAKARKIPSKVKHELGQKASHCVEDDTVIHKLGAGIHGSVYLLASGRVAKIHTVRLGKYDIDVDFALTSFEGELRRARIAADLGVSPKVHDAFACVIDDGFHRVTVMDQVVGESLEDWYDAPGRTAKEMKAMKATIRTMVEKLQARGVYHNDLHDENVMVDRRGRPVIIDFSLSTDAAESKARDELYIRYNFINARRKVADISAAVAQALLAQGVIRVA